MLPGPGSGPKAIAIHPSGNMTPGLALRTCDEKTTARSTTKTLVLKLPNLFANPPVTKLYELCSENGLPEILGPPLKVLELIFT